MHGLTLLVVDEPTVEAVKTAMAAVVEQIGCDYWAPGGRFDGFLQGAEEVKRRATTLGYDAGPANRQVALNYCTAADLLEDLVSLAVYLVMDGKSYYYQYWDENAPSTLGEGRLGAFVPSAEFQKRFKEMREKNSDRFVVAIDIHVQKEKGIPGLGNWVSLQ